MSDSPQDKPRTAAHESDPHHELLLRSWAQAFWETDAGGVVVTDSPSWRAYTGQTLEEWLGYGWLDAVHPEDRAGAERQWRDAMAVCGLVNAEFRLRAPDGGWRWTNVRAAPVPGAGGSIEKWVGMNVDITERKRAELALRESEERYRTVFEAIDEGVVTFDVTLDADGKAVDARYVENNAALGRMTGLTIDIVGERTREVLPNLEPFWFDTFQRVIETGEPSRFEYAVHDLQDQWFDVFASRVGGEGSSRIVLVYNNITARRRAEAALRETQERQAFLLELSDALRPIGDPVELQRVATRKLGEHLKASRVFYVVVEEDGDTAAILGDHTVGVSSRTGRYSLSDFSSAAVSEWRAGRIASTSDVNTDPRYNEAEREAYASVSTRAGFGVPLIKEGRLVALLGVNQSVPRQWTAYDTGLASEVAERTWAAVERARAEGALRESEALRRVALAGGRMGTWRWNPRDRLVWGDAPFLALWGFPPSDDPLSLSLFTSRQSPDGIAQTEAVVSGAIQAEEEFDATVEVVSGPTAGRWLRWRGRASADDPSVLYGVSFDITEQVRTEASFRESEKLQAFLLSLSDALRPLDDPHVIAAHATRLLGEHLQADRTFFTQVEADGVSLHVRDEYLRSGALSVLGRYSFDQFGAFVRRELREGRMLAVEDVSALDGLTAAERANYDAVSIAAYLLVPLVRNGGLAAFLTINHGTARAWTAADRVMAQETADRTWTAMERARAEAALRASEERFRQFGEASQDVLWIRDAETFQWEYLTPAFEATYGLDRAAALRGDNMANWLDLIVAEDRNRAAGCLRRVRDGEAVTFEYRVRRPVDGELRWLRNTDFPIRDAAGEVVRIGGIGQDVTELKEIEEALTAAELRQRALVEGIPQLVWRAVDGGEWTWASPQWTGFTGQSDADSHGWGWLDTVHPDDKDAARQAWATAEETGGFEVEYRIRRYMSDEYRWFQTRATPVRGGGNTIIEWLGTSNDVHDLRGYQERQAVLVEELQHRTRNLLGVVRSTADMTLRTSGAMEEFTAKFRDRLDALARVQGLLSRLNEGDRVTFDELIGTELSALSQVDGSDRITLDGPKGVALRSSTVQTFAMGLHELATNALKYGALKQPGGHLAVTWRLDEPDEEGQPWLHVDWQESGVAMPPADARPRGDGAGRSLIERALPYQLGARVTYVMSPDGVRCSISLPVSTRTGIDGNKADDRRTEWKADTRRRGRVPAG